MRDEKSRQEEIMGIIVNLDVMMAKRKIGLTELANEVDLTLANLSILKNPPVKFVDADISDHVRTEDRRLFSAPRI